MVKYQQSPKIYRFFTKGHPVTYAKGQILVGNDPVPDAVYYISTGYVKIYSVSNKGDEYLHVIYGPGDIFPLVWAYLDVEPESLYYQTISTCSLWRVSRYWFNEYISRDIELAHDMSIQLARQFMASTDRLDNLEYKKASERVAYLLLFFASRFGRRQEDGIIIEVPLTHEMFANSINLARESVSREIEKLEKDKIITKSRGFMLIKDVEALSQRLSRPANLTNWNLY